MSVILSERVTNYAADLTLQVAQDKQCSLRHVRDRIALVGLGAVLAVTNTIDALLGHAELLVELITLGKVQIEDTKTTRKRYLRLFQIVRQPFACLVSALHPLTARIDTSRVHTLGFSNFRSNLEDGNRGLISGIGIPSFGKKLDQLSASSDFFTRHVVSRLNGLAFSVICLVARVLEVVAGALLVIPVLLFQGQSWEEESQLYELACFLLAPAGIAFDLTVGVTAIIAPQSVGAVLKRCAVLKQCESLILDEVEAQEVELP